MLDRYVPGSDEDLNPLETNPVVDEQLDSQAEESFFTTLEVDDYVKDLVDNVSEGLDVLSYDESFRSELTQVLYELVQTFVRNNVNTLRLETDQFAQLKGELQVSVDRFMQELRRNIGFARDVSDVRETKHALSELFRKDYLSRVLTDSAEEVDHDYKFYIYTNDSGDITTVDFVPSNNDGEGNQVTFCTLESLDQDIDPRDGDLSSQISENMPLYTLGGVNPEIANRAIFDRIVFRNLHDDQLRTFNVSQSANYVFNLLKDNLLLPEGEELFTLNNMMADGLPVESLLNGKSPVCCRHIVYLFKIVSDAIAEKQQRLFGSNSSQAPLFGVTYMPVTMGSIAHATLAISKGDSITNIEPTWSIQHKQDTIMDATFSQQHGTSMLPILKQLQMQGEGYNQIVSSYTDDQFNSFLYANHANANVIPLIVNGVKQITHHDLESLTDLPDLNEVSVDRQERLCAFLIHQAVSIMRNVTELDFQLHVDTANMIEGLLLMEGLHPVIKHRLEVLVLPVYKALTRNPLNTIYLSSTQYLRHVDLNTLEGLCSSYIDDPSNLNRYLTVNYFSLVIANLERASAIFKRQIESGAIVSQSTINVFLEHNQKIESLIASVPNLKDFDDNRRMISQFTDYLNAQASVFT